MPELLGEKRHERGKEAERNGHAVIEHGSGNLLLFTPCFVFIRVPFQNWLDAFLGEEGTEETQKSMQDNGHEEY